MPKGITKGFVTAGYWEIAYRSAFILRYYDEDGNVNTLFTGQPECKKNYEPSTSGGSFTFDFADYQISFQAVYSLSLANYLRITIPFRQIKDPRGRLLDIRVLPYFGALEYQSKGYLVMPDGCGGLFKPYHLAQNYLPSRIYGERFYYDKQYVDHQSIRVLQLSDYAAGARGNLQNSFLSLPLFGIVKENEGILGIVTEGQFQAELGVEVTSNILRSAVSPRLIIREISYDRLGQLHATLVFNRRDRVVDYYFLKAAEATYAGIGRKYRELILGSLQSPPSGGYRLSTSQTQFRLRLFMGVNEQYLDTTRLICLTNFKQAENILQDLIQKGVRHLQVTLAGWSNRGYLGDNPRHFPPDLRFGGNDGLKKLLATARKLGIFIGLQFDNSYTFKKSHGFKRGDTVKDMQGLPVDIGFGRNEFLFCPQLAWDRFLKTDLKTIRELKCNGALLIEGMNQGLFNCFDKLHPTSHQKMAAIVQNSFREVSKTNPVAVTAASNFLYGNVAALYDLPTLSSRGCDEVVPLIPMICHGWLPYSFEPLNSRRDNRREFLKMVEYGAVPNAYLTAGSVAELVHAQYNPIFSGKYTDWRERLVNEYRIYERDLRRLQNQIMIDHQCLFRNVYLTVYDDGTKTIVNYGPDNYAYRSASGAPVTVKSLNYVIIQDK
ncbi:MAG TPA: DUF5696 domain-containing protein [Bacillota bacterium]|nr:DUF5696 domain-containing protein [Bacillota bacterium]